ncbi:hypothetical protein [Pectobacterium versatile]|uniref:hypothetical protein n=1 Tax=Pectobacterium versatile TaxID=2488639 RepID=UPI000F8CB22F|nr:MULTISPECIES: hypothetical protein [Pectobacterium]MCL6375501.1 hypothetical protein [Pectobacterium atrosepticum]RUR87887.1 hypothetical protein PB16LOC_04287 [Pectobacterium versatile]
MAANKTGLLIHFDENRRRDLIQEKVEGSYEPFSDALSVHDWEIGQLSIALLCFSDTTIDYIALAKKGKRVVTSKSRIEFSSTVALNSIPIQALESKLSDHLQRYFIKASQGLGGAIPERTWLALVDAIKSERPSLAGDIDRLLSLRRYSGFRLHGESAEILLQEREAIGISLDIFSGSNQLRERVLSEWAPNEGSVEQINETEATAKLTNLESGQSAFLTGIPQRYLQEESAIQHDLFNWPGMTPMHQAGVSIFEQGGRRLQVNYANRNDLEHTLGVDLIYYNEPYELFVLVQYKLMREEGDRVLYRPDAQLAQELVRMDDFYNSTRSAAAIQSHNEYRLSDDGFMVKLVPNKGLRPASGELIKGMYVPREYMHFLLGPNGPKGPQGGPQITFEGAPRYLTNSQFAASVNAGWIGSRGVQSQTVRNMIQSFYETGKALVVAYESE